MPLHSRISVKNGYFSVFYYVLFLYFFTLSADNLNLQVALFKFKFSNILAVTLLCFFLLNRRTMVFPKSSLVPSLFLFGSMLVSALLGAHVFRSMGYLFAFGLEFICYFLIPFNLIYQCNKEKVLKLYLWSFKCVGVYAMSQLLLSLIGIQERFVRQWFGNGIARPMAFTYEPSYYALYMTALVMFYNAMFLMKGRDETKKYPLSEFVLLNIFLLGSTSTAGFFSYFIFFAVCIIFHLFYDMKKYSENFIKSISRVVLFLTSFLAIISLFYSDLIYRFYFKFFFHGMAHFSFAERWRGIVNAWNTFLENPLFGVGIGGMGPYLHAKESNLPSQDFTLLELEHFDPTNVFTEVLACLGIVGMIGFVLLAFWVFGLFKHVLNSKEVAIQEQKTAIALFISLIVVIIELQFNQGLFRNYIWAHTGIVCGYLARLRKEYTVP